MRKGGKGVDWEGEFLRRGQKVPEGLLRRRMAEVKRSIAASVAEKRAIRRQAAKYWSEIQKPGRAPVGSKKALDGLLAQHRRLAKRKLAAPKVPSQVGGIFGGGFAATIVPPFDYAYTLAFPEQGNATLTGSASKNTGQTSGSAVTDFNAPSRGGMYTEMGIYFRPSSQGILRVSASPAISILWWTNSLHPDSTVVSLGSAGLGVWTQQGIMGPAGNGAFAPSLTHWDEEATGQILVDIGSNPHEPLSVQLQVDPTWWCILFFATDNHVEGLGWPGSLAGSMTTTTLPSISLEFDPLIVAYAE
jgi:hypothetical protein